MKSFALTAVAAYLLAQASAQQFVMYTGSNEPDGDDESVQRADPILAPGSISQHVHQIWGSDAFAPEVSYESLQKATCTTVGDASGKGNKADKSIYWHPALYMEAKDGSGYLRIPTLGHKFYYKNAGTGTPREPFEFPHGFRMLAGNPFLRAAPHDVSLQNITQWICHSSTGSNQGTAGGFPNGVEDCDAYPGFNGAVHFPHCWNGDDFNPADPTAHVSYPVGDIEEGTCPKSHPIRLPHIFAENQFNLHSMVDKVKPNTFTLAMGDNTGYGWHLDFFNGWDDGAIPALLDQCPQGDYGNEDIGLCPNFEPWIDTNSCQLKTTYHEKVDSPGQNLPGCNPVSDTNPAPFYQTAPLGTYSTNCKLVSSGSAPSKPSPPSKPSTFTTHTKPTSTSSPKPPPSHPGGSNISCPSSNGKTYTVGGKKFIVQCGTDHAGGDLKSVTAQSLGDCVAACAATKGCVDVSLSGVACYMKSAVGQKLQNSAINGARLISSGKRDLFQQRVAPAPRHRHIARHGHH